MQAETRAIVLVVDDAPESVSMLTDILEQAGATVLVALEGLKALSIARQVTPDIVLMDAVMPGIDGFETCRRMKREESLSAVPVVFMTGLSDTEHIVRGLEAGGVDYITKPIVPDELLARIRVHLANARIARGAQAALDTAGRYLVAVDEQGALLWWTPQAGKLLARLLTGGPSPGVRLEPVAEALAGGAATLEARGESGEPVCLTLVGRISRNENLFRVSEVARRDQDVIKAKLPVTDREAEVLLWLARGKSNRDISEILELSPRTVNKHLEQIFKKIGVENRTSAAAIVIRVLSE